MCPEAEPHTLVSPDDPEVESFEGRFFRMRRALGATGFGINEIRLGPGRSGQEHDETATGHEEVYVVLEGAGTFTVAGTDVPVAKGDYLRVAPTVTRTATAGPDGLRFIAIGARPREEHDGREVL